jgi:hypothetical protein
VDLETFMDLNLIREQSLKAASRLGFEVNKTLPLLDEVLHTRTADEAVKRLMCLHATAACAYGFDRRKARTWLEQENAWRDLTASEQQFVEGGNGDPNRFKIQIEGMWTLAWALGIVPCLDFGKDCDNKFVMVLPNLKIGEKGDALRSRVKPRATNEIIAACDLAYCLHWAVTQAQLTGGKLPGKVQPYVIEERRHALEWLLSNDQWDEVPLDT